MSEDEKFGYMSGYQDARKRAHDGHRPIRNVAGLIELAGLIMPGKG
jgi:hypothetical protein